MSEDNLEKINQLQVYEQSLQNILMQKQQFQAQLNEMDSALSELDDTDASFKIIGNVMVKTDKKKLIDDLSSKKKAIEIRIKTIEKQEDTIKDKTKKIRSEVMEKMKD